jgi:hypothetical protein
MQLKVALFFFGVMLASVRCQSLGQGLSQQSASISGQFGDLRNAFGTSGQNGMSVMTAQAKDLASNAQNGMEAMIPQAKLLASNVQAGMDAMPSQVKAAVSNLQDQLGSVLSSPQAAQVQNAASNAQNQLQGALSGTGAQITSTKDALANLGNKVGDTVGKIGNGAKTNPFWNKELSTKLHGSAQKLLEFKDIDSKFNAPKTELANYMVNTEDQPSITEMVNLARKHLSADDAAKFFEQMASVANKEKW